MKASVRGKLVLRGGAAEGFAGVPGSALTTDSVATSGLEVDRRSEVPASVLAEEMNDGLGENGGVPTGDPTAVEALDSAGDSSGATAGGGRCGKFKTRSARPRSASSWAVMEEGGV